MTVFKRRLKTEVSRLLSFWTLWEICKITTLNIGHQSLQKQIFLQNKFSTTRITRLKGGAPLYTHEMKLRDYRWKVTNTRRRERITNDQYDVRITWETARHSDQRAKVQRKKLNSKKTWLRLHSKREIKYWRHQCTRKCMRRFLKDRRRWCIHRLKENWQK